VVKNKIFLLSLVKNSQNNPLFDFLILSEVSSILQNFQYKKFKKALGDNLKTSYQDSGIHLLNEIIIS
jgi:hypothetical protein